MTCPRILSSSRRPVSGWDASRLANQLAPEPPALLGSASALPHKASVQHPVPWLHGHRTSTTAAVLTAAVLTAAMLASGKPGWTRVHGSVCCKMLQGTHTAMLSGMCGGEAAFRALTQEPQASQPGARDMTSYENAMKVGFLAGSYCVCLHALTALLAGCLDTGRRHTVCVQCSAHAWRQPESANAHCAQRFPREGECAVPLLEVLFL